MSGQRELFLQIWNERAHRCTVCSSFLGHEPLAHYFAHVLSKGAYPKFKLNPCNIVLMCLPCHSDFDHGNCNLDKFDYVNELKQELKEKYFKTT